MPKVKLIYIMGAGRSGTTALATFLGTNNDIQVLGEMHQLFEHIQGMLMPDATAVPFSFLHFSLFLAGWTSFCLASFLQQLFC